MRTREELEALSDSELAAEYGGANWRAFFIDQILADAAESDEPEEPAGICDDRR